MRLTRHRQYPVEERHVDEAGASLHGGHDGTKPVLADAIDADMHTVLGRLAAHDTRFGELTDVLAAALAFIDRFPDLRIQTGRAALTFAARDAHSYRVTFPTAFANTPIVLPNIDDAPGATARWDVRAINTSTTGFTFFVYSNEAGAATAWSNVGISWLALSLNG